MLSQEKAFVCRW